MAMLIFVYSYITLTSLKRQNPFPLSPNQVKQFLENNERELRRRKQVEQRTIDTVDSESEILDEDTVAEVSNANRTHFLNFANVYWFSHFNICTFCSYVRQFQILDGFIVPQVESQNPRLVTRVPPTQLESTVTQTRETLVSISIQHEYRSCNQRNC